MTDPEEINRRIRKLSRKLARGDKQAEEMLLPLVYEELYRIAKSLVSKQPLQATELVNEFYLKFFPNFRGIEDRHHMMRVAAKVMGHILIDLARKRKARKREEPGERVGFEGLVLPFEERSGGLVELDRALRLLEQVDREASELVDLRFFGGRTIREAADALGMSVRSANRKWKFARAWLKDQIQKELQGPVV